MNHKAIHNPPSQAVEDTVPETEIIKLNNIVYVSFNYFRDNVIYIYVFIMLKWIQAIHFFNQYVFPGN